MKIVIEIPDHVYEHAKNMSEDSNDEYEAMRAIAKGQEERPHGEWEQIGEMTYRCTQCGWLKKTGLMPYCENCIHYGICVVNSYCHEPCGYYEEDRPHEMWEHLKEHITEMRDADGKLNQKDTCQFILNLMGVIEREGEAE